MWDPLWKWVTFMKTKFGWVKVKGIKYEDDISLHVDGTITKRKKKKEKNLKI
jgi:hypothetical protein